MMPSGGTATGFSVQSAPTKNQAESSSGFKNDVTTGTGSGEANVIAFEEGGANGSSQNLAFQSLMIKAPAQGSHPSLSIP